MKNLRTVVVSLLILTIMAQAGFNLSGTVTDRAGNGISGVSISLTGAGLSNTSSTAGTWSLTGTSSVKLQKTKQGISRWTGHSLEVRVTSSSNVAIEAFDLLGTSQGRLATVHLEPGTHLIPLALRSSGMNWLRVSINGHSETLLAGTGIAGKGIVSASPEILSRSFVSRDTLRFTFQSKIIAQFALTIQDTAGIITSIDTSTSIGWNDTVTSYGTLYDTRDGQVYRTIKIGGQTWMAENLNFKADSSWWFNGCEYASYNVCDSINENRSHGARYGRLYKWASIMGLSDTCNYKLCLTPDSCQNAACAASILPYRSGICPSGWHVPSDTEWTILGSTIEQDSRVEQNSVGRALKAQTGWMFSKHYSGWDLFGFRALASGLRTANGLFYSAGSLDFWWSATENDATFAGDRLIDADAGNLGPDTMEKTHGFAARCIQD